MCCALFNLPAVALRQAKGWWRVVVVVVSLATITVTFLLTIQPPPATPTVRHNTDRCKLQLTARTCHLNSTRPHSQGGNHGNCSLPELTQDCPAFLTAHGYLQLPVTEEEKLFPLAFAIRMHRSPAQAERLLRAIYRPHNFYCIHVDAKAEAEVYAIMAAVGACAAHVEVLRDRVAIEYGRPGDGMVQADLRCMQAALHSPVRWRYLLTLCGEEFPLRTNLEMVAILKLFRGANDVESFPFPPSLRSWFQASVARKGHVFSKGKITLSDFPGREADVYNKGQITLSDKGDAFNKGQVTLSDKVDVFNKGQITLSDKGDVFNKGQFTLNDKADVSDKGQITLSDFRRPLQFEVRKGSAYASLTRGFVQAVFRDPRARAVVRCFSHAFAPEETVWATLNALPGMPGGFPGDVTHTANQQASRAVAWRWDRYRCRGDYLRAVCVFSTADLPWLREQPQLLANKFVEEKDSLVLDCLEAEIFQRAMSGRVQVNRDYFENLPHVRFYRDREASVEK